MQYRVRATARQSTCTTAYKSSWQKNLPEVGLCASFFLSFFLLLNRRRIWQEKDERIVNGTRLLLRISSSSSRGWIARNDLFSLPRYEERRRVTWSLCRERTREREPRVPSAFAVDNPIDSAARTSPPVQSSLSLPSICSCLSFLSIPCQHFPFDQYLAATILPLYLDALCVCVCVSCSQEQRLNR